MTLAKLNDAFLQLVAAASSGLQEVRAADQTITAAATREIDRVGTVIQPAADAAQKAANDAGAYYQGGTIEGDVASVTILPEGSVVGLHADVVEKRNETIAAASQGGGTAAARRGSISAQRRPPVPGIDLLQPGIGTTQLLIDALTQGPMGPTLPTASQVDHVLTGGPLLSGQPVSMLAVVPEGVVVTAIYEGAGFDAIPLAQGGTTDGGYAVLAYDGHVPVAGSSTLRVKVRNDTGAPAPIIALFAYARDSAPLAPDIALYTPAGVVGRTDRGGSTGAGAEAARMAQAMGRQGTALAASMRRLLGKRLDRYAANARAYRVGASGAPGTFAQPVDTLAALALSAGADGGVLRGSAFRAVVGPNALISLPAGASLQDVEIGRLPQGEGAGGAAALPIVTPYQAVPNGAWTAVAGWPGIYEYTHPAPSYGTGRSVGGAVIAVFDNASDQLLAGPSGRQVLNTIRDGHANIGTLDGQPNGTSYTEITGAGVRYVLKPLDGVQPGSGDHTYEIPRTEAAILDQGTDNLTVAGLYVEAGTWDTGAIGLGNRSTLERMFMANSGGTHHAVQGSGVVHDVVLYGTSYTPGRWGPVPIAHTFYQGSPAPGETCLMERALFIDTQDDIYIHTANGAFPFASLVVRDTWHLRSLRDGGKRQRGRIFAAENVKTALWERGFVEAADTVFLAGSVPTTIRELVVKSCRANAVLGDQLVLLRDSVIRADATEAPYAGGADPRVVGVEQGSLTVLNSILWADGRTPTNLPASPVGGLGVNADGGFVSLYDSIVILDVPEGNQANIVNANQGGLAQEVLNYEGAHNVFVLLGRGEHIWSLQNQNVPGKIPKSLAEWQFETGQDQNSIVIDLRFDPRGLKALFRDPDAGDFRLASTDHAARLAAFVAGPAVSLSRWPEPPAATADEALAWVASL